jgi:hypothetical protein
VNCYAIIADDLFVAKCMHAVLVSDQLSGLHVVSVVVASWWVMTGHTCYVDVNTQRTNPVKTETETTTEETIQRAACSING